MIIDNRVLVEQIFFEVFGVGDIDDDLVGVFVLMVCYIFIKEIIMIVIGRLMIKRV